MKLSDEMKHRDPELTEGCSERDIPVLIRLRGHLELEAILGEKGA